MKKIVAILLVLSLAVAGVFAQAPVITQQPQFVLGGYVKSGFVLLGADPYVGQLDGATIGNLLGSPSENTLPDDIPTTKLGLGGVFIGGGGKWGATFGIGVIGLTGAIPVTPVGGTINFAQTAVGSVALDYAYAWFQPWSFIKLTAGDIDGKAWGTPGAYDTGYDDVDGIRLEFTNLLPGLNFGVAYGLSDWTSIFLDNFGKSKLVVGAKYVLADLGLTTMVAYHAGFDDTGADLVLSSDVIFGVGYSFPFGLGLILDGGIGFTTKDGEGIYLKIDEKVTFAALDGALNLELVLKEELTTKNAGTFKLAINPAVAYNVIPGLALGVQSEIGLLFDDPDTNDVVDWLVRPYIEYTLAKDTSIKIYDQIHNYRVGSSAFAKGAAKGDVNNDFGVALKVTF